MTRTGRAVATVAVSAGLLVGLPGGTALADPAGGETIALTCGGRTYSVTSTPSDAEFTPAFDLDGSQVFVPVAFGAFSGTVTGPGGFTSSFTDEATSTKGSGKQRGTVDCTYVVTETMVLTAEEAAEQDLPGAGTYVFTGTGTVTAQVRGH